MEGIRILYTFLHLFLILACIMGYACFMEAKLGIRGQFGPISYICRPYILWLYGPTFSRYIYHVYYRAGAFCLLSFCLSENI